MQKMTKLDELTGRLLLKTSTVCQILIETKMKSTISCCLWQIRKLSVHSFPDEFFAVCGMLHCYTYFQSYTCFLRF